MVKIVTDPLFERTLQRIKNVELKERVRKQVLKILKNPSVGKPMRYERRDSREVYIPPLRLSYHYAKGTLTLLDLYHKDEQ